MSVDVIQIGDSGVVVVQTGTDVLSGGEGPQGIQGLPARQDLSPFFQGQLGALELLYRVTLAGSVNCDAAHSAAAAMRGATSAYTISICKNATYANALAPQPSEIAAALWATASFASNGQGAPQSGSVAYASGGTAVEGDMLDFWAASSSDPTLTDVSLTLAGP